MVELDEEVVDIFLHRKTASAVCVVLRVVPFHVDAGSFKSAVAEIFCRIQGWSVPFHH